MELSLEEALDICLELIGCSTVIIILQMILHADALLSIFWRIL